MKSHNPYILLKIETKSPIELFDFVGLFSALGEDYQRFSSDRSISNPNETKIFIREVRVGSIEADLVPWLTIFAPFIADMERILIVEDFVNRWSKRISSVLSRGVEALPDSQSELRTWSNMVQAIANDPDGKATISAALFEDNKRKIRAAVEFNTSQAQMIGKFVEEKRNLISLESNEIYTRKIMVFTRSDVNKSEIHKKSGERVLIEELFLKPLPLIYGSELAEEKIKHEIREADENVFKKGFVVDVAVKRLSGKPIAFTVTNLHSVFDLETE